MKIAASSGCVRFFFFKQKTAYVMRISEWCSDVCSSDLAVILQNTVDMMRALQKLADDGVAVSGHDVAFFAPYLTGGVKRFGDYRLDLKRPPEQWIRDRLFKDAAKAARATTIATEQGDDPTNE